MMAQLMRRATEAHEGLSPSVISKPVQKEDEEPELDDAAVAKAVADIIAAGDNPYCPRLARALELYKRRVIETQEGGSNAMIISLAENGGSAG
jgi:hypothetical protein